MLINFDGAQCRLEKDGPKKYYVYSLCVPTSLRNQGRAKRLLRAIRKFSDKTGYLIELIANPFPLYNDPKYDPKTAYLYYKTNRNRVVKLYKRMGFKRVKKSYVIVYTPKSYSPLA